MTVPLSYDDQGIMTGPVSLASAAFTMNVSVCV